MDLKRFLLAGNATFTVGSRNTGTRYTYRVVRTPDSATRYFVSVLTGSDNARTYRYAGLLETSLMDGFLTFLTTAKSFGSETTPSIKGFLWLVNQFNHGKDPEQQADIYHEGKCGRCGRPLTVPASIESGFGPECAQAVAL